MTAPVWTQLRSAALVGAARQPLPRIDVDGPAAALVSHVDGTESGVLLAAGALALARRSGVAAARDAALPAPAGPEDRPLPPAPARERLRAVMDGTADVERLALWLQLAQARHMRIPPRELPALFQLARVRHELRPLVIALAGERGQWLASQHRDWQWVLDGRLGGTTPDRAEEPDERLWQEGSLAERVAYLTALRRYDPGAARDRLADVWPTEAPAERAAFLSALADGLSLADEEFCEAALGDRRKEVRVAAAGLLAGLAGSAYQNRMIARARAYVHVGRKISVRPPAECDASMKRDGVEPKPPIGTGERAWWLEQVVAATPLSVWCDGKSPEEVLGARVEPGWRQTLHRAWARAAARTRDVDWAVALIDLGFGRGDRAEMHDAVLAASLHDLLPPAMAAERALRLLRSRSAPDIGQLSAVLEACSRPWPSALADALLRYLHDQIAQADRAYVSPRLRTLAGLIVSGLALDAVAALSALAERVRTESQRAGGTESQGVRLMDSLVINVSVRQAMFQEFE